MAWLSDWAKRIPIYVDHSKIDSDLTHFPIPIVLGTSVGQDGDDLTAVFDELKQNVLSFDGVDDYVELPNNFGIFDGSSSFSILIWINIHEFVDKNIFLSFKGENDIKLQAGEKQNDTVPHIRSDFSGHWQDVVVGNSMNTGEWYHIAVTYDTNDGWRMYQAGDQVDSNSSTGSIASSNEDTSAIGFETTEYPYMDGKSAGLEIWNRALSQTEIQDNMNKRLNGDESGLVAYYKLDEGTGTTATDSAGSNDGTINGEAAWSTGLSLFSRKKIAVTKDDGETQLYVEVEQWDDDSEQAVLWVSKSDLTLSSSGVTTLYLYYDKSKADNTSYVGDPGNRTEVWDGGFEIVWHLNQDPTGQMLDSTSNNHDVVPDNMSSSALAQAILGKGLEMDGSDDGIFTEFPEGILTTSDSWTVQWLVDLDVIQEDRMLALRGDVDFIFAVGNAIAGEFGYWNGSSHKSTGYSVSTDTVYHISLAYDEGQSEFNPFINAVAQGPFSENFPDGTDSSHFVQPNNPTDGLVDEFRLSTVRRSDAWIKADYYAQTDDLLTFGGEETPPKEEEIAIPLHCISKGPNLELRDEIRKSSKKSLKLHPLG